MNLDCPPQAQPFEALQPALASIIICKVSLSKQNPTLFVKWATWHFLYNHNKIFDEYELSDFCENVGELVIGLAPETKPPVPTQSRS